ncbi:hypothetical protein E2C01_033674 [Portunus trituberculatus]|uniref:Uncharacterized protein n=1 Tax=Portunus trituberculatus TaxID=210409 RepID=A0A5B7EYI4_PORTR|nr:hypothetical protein [Portunus trituberculatus]
MENIHLVRTSLTAGIECGQELVAPQAVQFCVLGDPAWLPRTLTHDALKATGSKHWTPPKDPSFLEEGRKADELLGHFNANDLRPNYRTLKKFSLQGCSAGKLYLSSSPVKWILVSSCERPGRAAGQAPLPRGTSLPVPSMHVTGFSRFVSGLTCTPTSTASRRVRPGNKR